MLAEGVTPFALSALKYGLLALLFLFIWRATRWAIRGLNVDSVAVARAGTTRGAEGSGPAPATLLVHESEGAKPRAVRLTSTMAIGRDAGCELRIDDTYASTQHARIFGKGDAWYVEDLGSTNGTFVNDQRLATPAMLQPGDRVRVGTTVLELRR